jgi:membrane protein DedA with SNARE-associated domain
MSDLIEFLLKYGYFVVFGAAFAEQIGLPLPAVPILVGMGALSRSGEFELILVLAAALTASLAADLIWYELGRAHGRSVLRLLCRIALEPDYCVRRTEDTFERFGLWALLGAKFIPGFNAAAVPLAGMMKTPLFQFLIFDAIGVTCWAGGYVILGYLFSRQIERVFVFLSELGTSLLVVLAGALALYVAHKYRQRHRFFQELAVLRITPEELKARMDANEDILIFDMRNRLDRSTDPVRIPGAFHVLPEHVEFQRQDLSFDRNIVLYCT